MKQLLKYSGGQVIMIQEALYSTWQTLFSVTNQKPVE